MKLTLLRVLLAATMLLLPIGTFAQSQSEAPLIPRRAIFDDDDRLNVRLSPDGAKIVYWAPVDGVMGAWVVPVDDPKKARLLFKLADLSAPNLQWAYTSQHLVYVNSSSKEVRLLVFDLADGQTRDLTPKEGGAVQVEKLSPQYPEEILIGLNHRDPKHYDLHRINILTGEMRLVLKNDGYDRLFCDLRFRPRAAMRATEDEGYELYSLAAEGQRKLLDRFSYEEAYVSQPSTVDGEGRRLYLIDNRRTDTALLRAIDLQTGKAQTLLEDKQADIRVGLLLHPRTGRPQSATAVYGRIRRYFLDQSIADDFKYLSTVGRGAVGVINRSLDDRVWLIAYLDGGPDRMYIYHRRSRLVRSLFSSQNAIAEYPLARRQAAAVTTRDGLKLPGDLYLPSWTRPGNRTYLDRPLPMLVYVHGGPSIAYPWDSWSTNRALQLLANRGYAVFRVEFRGAVGFGKKILLAGAKEWGRKMQDDILDAVDWAVKEGITERHRVGIWGWSYGGYATVAALAFTPDVFACGMAMYYPADLQPMMESRGGGGFHSFWRKLVGDETTEEGRALLRSRSPLYFAQNITRPLLITHGALDTNVPRKYSDDLAAEMKKYNKPVTYLLYPDEGHDYRRKENWTSLFAVAERFFHEHLGGRYEAIGEDLIGSGMEVVEGGNLIPDLADAMRAKSRTASLR